LASFLGVPYLIIFGTYRLCRWSLRKYCCKLGVVFVSLTVFLDKTTPSEGPIDTGRCLNDSQNILSMSSP
jgi:hypothetical protein